MAQPTKADLRKEFLNRREALDPAERKRGSSLIRQRIFQHPQWRASTTVLVYVSFGSEVETHALLSEAIRFKKRVVVPDYDSASPETPLSELRRFGDLGSAHRGILQVKPELRRAVDPALIDLALIPGIAFDLQGGRIGFGGGYFDRLLPAMPKGYRLGLAFSSQVSPVPLPLEAFDIRMQAIVTEKAVIETGLP